MNSPAAVDTTNRPIILGTLSTQPNTEPGNPSAHFSACSTERGGVPLLLEINMPQVKRPKGKYERLRLDQLTCDPKL